MALIGMISLGAVACTERGGNGDDDESVIEPFAPTGVLFSQTLFQGETGSSNGKYVAGSNYETGNAAIWDVEANKVIDMADFPGGFHAVNAKGVAVGEASYAIMGQGTKGTTLYYDDTEIEVSYEDIDWETGEPYTVTYTTPAESGSSAYAITEAGDIIAGYYYDASYNTKPCIWKAPFTTKASRIELPVPTDEEMGFIVNGAEARWISEDGSVIAGWAIDDYASDPLIIWEAQADGSYKVKPVSAAYNHPEGKNNSQYMFFEPQGLSANGKWVSLVVAAPYDFENWEQPVLQTARLNLETGVLEVLPGEVSFSGYGISNDGTVAGATGGMVPVRNSYVWNPGETTCVELTTLVASDQLKSLTNPAVGYIAPDNSYVSGFGSDADWNIVTFVVK